MPTARKLGRNWTLDSLELQFLTNYLVVENLTKLDAGRKKIAVYLPI
jgi:hypothetical protein